MENVRFLKGAWAWLVLKGTAVSLFTAAETDVSQDNCLNPDIRLMARAEEFVEIPAFLVSRKR